MKGPEMVALAASVGACASAVAGFFTVREIAKQREAAFRPEIVPSSTSFVATKRQTAKSDMPDCWREGSLLNGTSVAGREVEISLINIGMGAARQVELNWSFDIEKAVKTANTLAQESLSATFFKVDAIGIKMTSADGGEANSIWSSQRQKRFDYVLPAAASASPERAAVPHAYCQLVGAIVQFSMRMSNSKIPEGLPELNLDISFEDIAGKSHQAKYVLSTSLTMLDAKGDGFEGRIHFTRRN